MAVQSRLLQTILNEVSLEELFPIFLSSTLNSPIEADQEGDGERHFDLVDHPDRVDLEAHPDLGPVLRPLMRRELFLVEAAAHDVGRAVDLVESGLAIGDSVAAKVQTDALAIRTTKLVVQALSRQAKVSHRISVFRLFQNSGKKIWRIVGCQLETLSLSLNF